MSDSSKKDLFDKLQDLKTEKRNPLSGNIDLADPKEIARIINDEDKKVAQAVGNKIDEIAGVIDLVSQSLSAGGRLLYFGAGTSGRLGVLDAAECPPTFGSKPEQIQGFIAGGKEAMFVAQEGAEDHEINGVRDIVKAMAAPPDVVCGLAASGRTPYVHGAIKEAASRGCVTVFVTTVPAEQIDIEVDHLIDVPVGPEVIMGSTRMKSATAQKMILNMITTGAMIRRGKIYENVMVDLMLTNEKLVERAKRIIMTFTGLDYETAQTLLEKSDGHVKTALLMGLGNISKEEARTLLNESGGFVREAFIKLKGHAK
ncbi:N-acetylmuramic acid 6-phosphate etherase [Balneola sp. MJW-20]|uniref:N-acetylmuramic acid 6-phosphate etherase n=1 Tax=Gracilimonas aurantiaca TaxID=3234185 RepID=UPI0034653470